MLADVTFGEKVDNYYQIKKYIAEIESEIKRRLNLRYTNNISILILKVATVFLFHFTNFIRNRIYGWV